MIKWIDWAMAVAWLFQSPSFSSRMFQLLARIPWTVSPSEVEGSVVAAAASEAKNRIWRDPVLGTKFEVLWGRECEKWRRYLDKTRMLCDSDEIPKILCRNKGPLVLRDFPRKRDMLCRVWQNNANKDSMRVLHLQLELKTTKMLTCYCCLCFKLPAMEQV